MAATISRNQVLMIAGMAECDPRTVVNIYNGGNSKALVRERVEAAARRLKIKAPPPKGVK